jgi:hypothetical protein
MFSEISELALRPVLKIDGPITSYTYCSALSTDLTRLFTLYCYIRIRAVKGQGNVIILTTFESLHGVIVP